MHSSTSGKKGGDTEGERQFDPAARRFQEGKPTSQTGRLGRNFSSECVGRPPTLSGQTAGTGGQEEGP